MIYTSLTKKAMNLMYVAHQNQFDKAGVPYVFHPYHLAEQMKDEYSTVVALLHDVVEDTDITIEDLQKDFPLEICVSVDLLTKKDGISYEEYIKKISQNSIARKVKLADLEHNSDMSRLDNPSDERNQKRLEKYKTWTVYLKKHYPRQANKKG